MKDLQGKNRTLFGLKESLSINGLIYQSNFQKGKNEMKNFVKRSTRTLKKSPRKQKCRMNKVDNYNTEHAWHSSITIDQQQEKEE
jgi:hypothetical protein